MDELLKEESIRLLGKLIYDISKTFGGDLYNLIKQKVKANDNYLHSISSRYLISFFNRYGHIQVLGMSKPMYLTNIYIEIQMLDSLGNDRYSSVNKLMKFFKENCDSNRSLQIIDDNKSDGIKTAERENRLMVLGAPGGGKSTYLKKIGIECLKGKNYKLKNYLPIMIELKNIDSDNDVYSLILNELEVANFPNPSLYLEQSLQNGKILLLFDGLDEIPQELEKKTINDIRDFCDQFSKNKFVISCRLAAYRGGLNNFTNIEIANFDERQIEQFINKWFKEKSKENRNYKDISTECWEKISSNEMQATMELAQSPLMLTLLCLVYNYQQDFPSNRSLLYKEAIDVQLKEWNASKRIHNNPVYKDMTLPFEELLLSHIAFKYFIKDEYFFNKADLAEFISEFISNNLNAPKYLDGSDILKAISIQQGILLERAKNIYSFSHLTFQEYFVAKYVDDYDLLDVVIDENLTNPKWREIFILLSGIMKTGSDKLLNSICTKAREVIKEESMLNDIFFLIDNNTKRSIQAKLTDLFILFVYSSNIDKYNGVTRVLHLIKLVDKQLAKKIESSWIIDKKYDTDIHLNLYIELLDELGQESLICKNLNNILKEYKKDKSINVLKSFLSSMNFNLSQFDKDSKNNIYKYLDTLAFLIHCKKASVLVTKENWKIIEQQMLATID